MKFKVGDKVMFYDWDERIIGKITEDHTPSGYYYKVEYGSHFIHLLPQEMTLLSPVLMAFYEEDDQ